MNRTEAWGVLANRLEGEDDLTDEECKAFDVLNAPTQSPREILRFVLAWGRDDEDFRVNGMDGRNRRRCAADLKKFLNV